MKFKLLQVILFLLVAQFGLASPTLAGQASCTGGITATFDSPIPENTNRATYSISLTNASTSHTYFASLNNAAPDDPEVAGRGPNSPTILTMDGNWMRASEFLGGSTYTIGIFQDGITNQICAFQVRIERSGSCSITLHQNGKSNPTCTNDASPISVSASNIVLNGQPYTGPVEIKIGGTGGNPQVSANVTNGTLSLTEVGQVAIGGHEVIIETAGEVDICTESFDVDTDAACNPDNQLEQIGENQGLTTLEVNVCSNVASQYRSKCEDCKGQDGIWTGLGCFSINLSAFMKQVFSIAIGLGGGLSFVLLIYGAFLLTTSTGDPKATDNAKGIITGAITGLLVIIFAAVILQIIGVEILQIPGF